MKLDIVTLMAASSFVAALAALVLGAAWISMRERALAWWATASTTTAVGVAMLANGLASLDQALIATGAAATDTSAVLVWAGTRTFCGRRAPLPLLVAAIAFVPLAGAVPLAGSPELSARLAGFSLWIAFLLGSCGAGAASPCRRDGR